MLKLKNPIILALDVDDKYQVHEILKETKDLVGAIKLGPRLVYRYGAELVSEISKTTPVFVDNKYFDIPSTMLAAVQASFDAGASLVTVHALSGKEALTALAKLEKKLNNIRPFKILAVSILTSWQAESMPASMKEWSVTDHVKYLARLTYDCGLTGLVCSGHELKEVSDLNMYKVTPGIRTDGDANLAQDQKRIMTPKEALAAGASALVIGRPILQAASPKEAVLKILESFT